jgi:putative ABC transport system substrate-binding protein
MKKAAISILAVVMLLAVAVLAEAQQAKKVPRIGFIDSSGGPAAPSAQFNAFREGLKEFGYIDGSNVYIENRYAEGKLDRMPALVDELVGQKVDVLVVNK